MKNKSIGSLILLAVLAPACGGGGGGSDKHPIVPPRWSEQYRFPTSSDLRAVRFGDALHGIVAGKNGTFVRTDDGGLTWKTLEYTPATLAGDVLAMDVGTITTIAVGADLQGHAIAWGSSDATTFVTPDPAPTTNTEPWVDVVVTVGSTSPPSAGTLRLRPSGFADAYQNGLLLPIPSMHNDQSGGFVADTPWTTAYGIGAFGSSGIWGVCGDNGGAGQIRVTTNNGQFFKTQTLTLTPPGPCPILRRIQIWDATHGFSVGDSDTIVTTSDMSTWTTIPKPAAIPTPGTLRAVFFRNPSLGWAVGDGGRIYKFTYSAPNWTSTIQNFGTGDNLYDVWFADDNTGYAVGDNGAVFKTTTGGGTWTSMTGPLNNPQATFRAVDFTASASIGLAVGDAASGASPATLLRSKDAGVTWTSFNTGIPNGTNLTAVAVPRAGSNTVAFVGTSTGAVYFNTDIAGTGTWTAATGSLTTAVKGMLFPKGDTTGFVSGATGLCCRVDFTPAVVSPPTAASGTVNAAMALPGTPAGTLYSLACDPTGNTVYVAGDGGYLASTTTSGASWNAVTPALPGGHSIRALQAPTGPNTTLFAGTDDNKVYKLSAGGSPAWSATALAGVGTPASMAFINDTQGWVVTQGTSVGIVFTIDGGTTWYISTPHVPLDATHLLNDIWMSSSGGVGVVVGDHGVLMQTTTGGQ